jgi:hypothetical protein
VGQKKAGNHEQTFFFIELAQIQAIKVKVNRLTHWLAENAPYCETDQKHLDLGTLEQAYWNYGYLCGVRDVLSLIHPGSAE